jgi:hypothetical protein
LAVEKGKEIGGNGFEIGFVERKAGGACVITIATNGDDQFRADVKKKV